MFKAGQLLHAIVLDSASLLISIHYGLQNDPIYQSHITHLQAGLDSTTAVAPNVQMANPWSLSPDGDFLCYRGQLYVPDHQATQLDVLCSCHDHRLTGHPGITKMIKNIHRQFYWPKMVAF